MKYFFAVFLSGLIVLTACNSSKDKPKQEPAETKTEIPKPAADSLFSCPMHPEVQGKKGEKCPKCGMFLTVPVK